MITVRRSNERGHFDHGRLDTYHTFSFADYYDPKHMGFRSLRVINEDVFGPGGGFGMHAHHDMEIITCVIDGALAHRDSLGNESTIRAGEVQRMTAGSGITHSEYNASKDSPVHLLQIWIKPDRKGLTPSYEQKLFNGAAGNGNGHQLIASPDGRDGSVTIHQDASLYLLRPTAGQRIDHPLGADRHAWLQVISGELVVGDVTLTPGDAAAISDESALTITARADSAALLFDLA